MTKKKAPRDRGTGSVRQLASSKWQARFRGPDGILRPAPFTFDTKLDAGGWLISQQRDVARGVWAPEPARPVMSSFRAYAEAWLEARDIKPSTRAFYRDLLDQHLLPALGPYPLDKISPTTVRGWYGHLSKEAPTRRAHSYSLLRSIMTTAVSDDLIDANPCRIRGAGSTKRVTRTQPATLPELETITEAMPERLRAMVLIAAWCGLRFGELAELRRHDLDIAPDLESGIIHVERGMTRVKGTIVIGDPKSEAGRRDVTIPPHLLPLLQAHLDVHTGASPDALLFPAQHGGHLVPSSLYVHWYKAREAAGRPDLRFHDLRHTGATLAAGTGASLAELMQRLGHSTPSAAMRYQHAAQDRAQAIALALSDFAEAKVIPLRKAR